MSGEARLAGLYGGEWVQNLGDKRLETLLPREEGEDDRSYGVRLSKANLAVVMTEDELKTGGEFPRLWAKAVSADLPLVLLVPAPPPAKAPKIGLHDGKFYVTEQDATNPERFKELRAQAEAAGLEIAVDEGG